MDTNMEKECSALGGLFQAIVNDLKNGVPVWEDFLAKATKFHSQLKATILAATAFLDAFQKIADLATNTKGATKEIGTALTRICLRHKAVEAKLKTFTSAIMECLILPLQDKMEEWKKTVTQLDKDHAKDYKRARQEIKKRASDTLRLQKKVRKGKCEIQRNLDTALQDVSDKFLILEETEKHALRTALIEERSRFCLFVSYLKPVVDEEVSMLSETSHFQEIMEQLIKSTTDPFTLPVTSEQVINDIKSFEGSWTFQTPPSSPSLVSSRKSSMCSISSVNSSSSGSTKCHSPNFHMRYRSTQQPFIAGTLRLSSVSSQDSGFTSQDTLFVRPHTPPPLELIRQISGQTDQSIHGSTSASSNASTPSSPYGMLPVTMATWPNLQETSHFDKVPCTVVSDRPHTISTAYERGHQRPPLTIHTFEPLDKISRQVNSTPSSPQGYENELRTSESSSCTSESVGTVIEKEQQPTIPQRVVTVTKPTVPDKSQKFRQTKSFSHGSPPASKGVSLPDFNQPAPDQIVPQPLYVNMNDIARTPDMYRRPIGSKVDIDEVIADLQQPHSRHPSIDSPSVPFALDGTTSFSEDAVSCGNADVLCGLVNLDEASKYCTIPRYANHTQYHPSCMLAVKRPSSTAGHPSICHYGTLQSRTGSLRRSGSQSGHKPPPPVRRTSSITSHHTLTVVQLRNAQSSQAIASSSSYSLSAAAASSPLSDVLPTASKLSHPNSEGNLERCVSRFEEDRSSSVVSLSSQLVAGGMGSASFNGRSWQEVHCVESGGGSVVSNSSESGSSSTESSPAATTSVSVGDEMLSLEEAGSGVVAKVAAVAECSPPVRKTSVVDESVAINQAMLIQSLNAKLAKQLTQQQQADAATLPPQQHHPSQNQEQHKQIHSTKQQKHQQQQQQHTQQQQQHTQQQQQHTQQQQQLQHHSTLQKQQQHQHHSAHQQPLQHQQHSVQQHHPHAKQQHQQSQQHQQQKLTQHQSQQQQQQHQSHQQQHSRQLQQHSSQQHPPPKSHCQQQHAADRPTSQKDVKTASEQPQTSGSEVAQLPVGTRAAPTLQQQHSQPAVFHESFLLSLNEKLAHHVQQNALGGGSPQGTPKSQRRSSAPAETHLSSAATPLLNFKQELNAKLAQQQSGGGGGSILASKSSSAVHHQQQQQHNQHQQIKSTCGDHSATGGGTTTATTSRVREMMANRVPYDPVTCRESMLDQIKRGATLRKVSTNDRSAPKIK